MNERIKELAKVAKEFATTKDAFGEYVVSFDGEKFEQKLAELIIKECLEQVRDEVQYGSDWKLADAVTKRVMEHFGVEQ